MHFVLPVLMSFSHSLFSLLVVFLARCLQSETEPPSSPLVAVCVQWFEQPSQGLRSSLHFQTSSPGPTNSVISSRKGPCLSVYPTSKRTGGEMMMENLRYIQFHKSSWQHHSFAVTIHLTDGEAGAQRR